MKIRPAKIDDAAVVMEILNPVIREPSITSNSVEKCEDDIVQMIETASCFFVADEASRVLGYASYGPFRLGIGYERTAEHSVVVAEGARGKGVGQALIAAIEQHATLAGLGALWAGVSGENLAGVRFHARMGYEETATPPKVGFKFERWMDLVLMRKWLDEAGQRSR